MPWDSFVDLKVEIEKFFVAILEATAAVSDGNAFFTLGSLEYKVAGRIISAIGEFVTREIRIIDRGLTSSSHVKFENIDDSYDLLRINTLLDEQIFAFGLS